MTTRRLRSIEATTATLASLGSITRVFAIYYVNLIVLCLLVKKIHYPILIQGSQTQHVPLGQPVQVSEPNHHFHDCPVSTWSCHVRQRGFYECGNEFQWRGANDSPGYYTIGEIIAVLNTMTDPTLSIFTKASSYGCIWIQSPHTIDFINAPSIWEILGLGGRTVILPASFYESNVIDTMRNRQVIQVYSSLVRSSDLKIVHQNNNLLTTIIIDDPTTISVDRWRTSSFQW